MTALRLANLEDALREIERLEAAPSRAVGDGWSVYKVLVHCRQSIDASVHGYPKLKPAIIRKTVGRFVARRFLSKGMMSHDLRAPIPGAAAIDDDGDIAGALAGLREAIHGFRDHDGALAPHFVFGDMDKRGYDQLHAMHIADHLSAIDYR